jgi:hypothetical protein
VTPLEISSMAKLTVKMLAIGRKQGAITPENPITGPAVVERYNLKFHAEVRDKDFPAVIHYARETMGEMIGSNTKGYFSATPEEYREVMERELARQDNQRKAILAPWVKHQKESQLILAVIAEFGAEKIPA